MDRDKVARIPGAQPDRAAAVSPAGVEVVVDQFRSRAGIRGGDPAECAPHGPQRLVARIPGNVHGLVLDSRSGEWRDLSAAPIGWAAPEAERPAKARWRPVAER